MFLCSMALGLLVVGGGAADAAPSTKPTVTYVGVTGGSIYSTFNSASILSLATAGLATAADFSTAACFLRIRQAA